VRISTAFVPKRLKGDPKPWVRFGSGKSEYKRWAPEICGICCLKMLGDTFHRTNNLSLYALTMWCLGKGGFKILPDNRIEGVFHQPLLELAKELGLDGWFGKLDQNSVIKVLGQQKFVILSIDLKKVNLNLAGSHLVLIHTYRLPHNIFIAHDPSFVLSKEGRNTKIEADYLDFLSNHKGIVLWPKSDG